MLNLIEPLKDLPAFIVRAGLCRVRIFNLRLGENLTDYLSS